MVNWLWSVGSRGCLDDVVTPHTEIFEDERDDELFSILYLPLLRRVFGRFPQHQYTMGATDRARIEEQEVPRNILLVLMLVADDVMM